jgi:hypothetical protein
VDKSAWPPALTPASAPGPHIWWDSPAAQFSVPVDKVPLPPETFPRPFWRLSIFGPKKEQPPDMGVCALGLYRTSEPSIHIPGRLSTVIGGLSTGTGENRIHRHRGTCLYVDSRNFRFFGSCPVIDHHIWRRGVERRSELVPAGDCQSDLHLAGHHADSQRTKYGDGSVTLYNWSRGVP